MLSRYPWKVVLLSSLIALGLLAFSYQQAHSVFTSPDEIGLACGAEHLFTTHTFSTLRTPFSFFDYVPCWSQEIYPGTQLIVAGVRFLTPSITWALGVTNLFLAALFPLAISRLAWTFKRNQHLAAWSAVLAAIFPLGLSTLVLTPQGMLGMIILVFMLSFVIRSEVKLWHWLMIVPFLTLLYFTHTLSFFFACVSLSVIWLFHSPIKHSWIFFIGSLTFGTLGSLLALSRSGTILSVLQGLYEQMEVIDQFQQRSILDHASVFGYALIPLCLFGLTSHVWKTKEKWLLGLWLLIPFLFAHLDIFGFSFLPHRMLWYMVPSVLLLSAAGLQLIISQGRSVLMILTVIAVVGTLFAQSIVLQLNNIEVYATPLNGQNQYSDVTDYLKQIPADQHILTMMTPQDRQALLIPLSTTADVISFPANQFKDVKNFVLAQPYWAFLAANKPTNPIIVRLRALAEMVEQPQLAQTDHLYIDYKIGAIVLKKSSNEAKAMKKREQFKVLFENDFYIIFQP